MASLPTPSVIVIHSENYIADKCDSLQEELAAAIARQSETERKNKQLLRQNEIRRPTNKPSSQEMFEILNMARTTLLPNIQPGPVETRELSSRPV